MNNKAPDNNNPPTNQGRPSSSGPGFPQYSIGDLYAMNPQFVQQYLAVRGITLNPNMIPKFSHPQA